ncbi:MAG: hypothetical protein ACRCYU_00775 [Nocardioides sp.]
MGVLLTLWFTNRRDQRKDKTTREDAYRADARTALAELLATAKTFDRHGRVLADVRKWALLGEERASALADTTEASMRDLQQRLVTASLLVVEPDLQQALGQVRDRADDVAAVIHESVDAFWDGRMPAAIVDSADQRWEHFGEACAALHGLGLHLLRPTIRL